MSKIRVVELFAGVGGFRVGLERASKRFETIWANQWEPSTKVQHAFDVYDSHYKNTSSINVNEDINKAWKDVPEHDLLVGGFPCQDYSVAQGNRAKGIKGKKGVLWWDIYNILEARRPKMVLLENVDRLLNSPTSQRGRDFAIILRSLNDLGYVVEWKSINAADYGFVQRRKRVFIYAYQSKKGINQTIEDIEGTLFESAFPSESFSNTTVVDISETRFKTLATLTSRYKDGKFFHSGISSKGLAVSTKYKPSFAGKKMLFKDIKDVNTKAYQYLTEDQKTKAAYTKAHKKIQRTTKDGFTYNYSEGKMQFPESMDLPGRTMLTSEGSINRSTHFFKHGTKIRIMTPLEAERMNGFPDNWTKDKTERQRFFFMGNALVTGIIEKIGKGIVNNEKK